MKKQLIIASICMLSLSACAFNTATRIYTVRFDSNGGSSISPIQVNGGKTVTRPSDPIKEGFEFDGWYISSSLSTLYDFAKPVYSSFTLYAGWEIEESNTWLISFNSNGGSSIDSIEVNDGDLLTMPSSPTKDGFEFAGWYKNSNLTNPYDFSTPVHSSFILYAKWEAVVPDAWTVNFISDGKVLSTQEVLNNGLLIQPNNPTKDGYEFVGWFKSGSTTQFDFSTQVTSSFDLYAKWSTQEYMVTFNLNYNNLAEVKYSTEDGYVTFVPERSGYVFNGWWYCDGIIDGKPILNRSFSTSTRVTSEGLELFAEWIEEKEYTNQLDAPVVSIDQYNISWEQVENASSYQIVITARLNGATETFVDKKINRLSYTFDSSFDANTYTIKIRAIGDGYNFVNSTYTTKTYAHKTLTSPRNFSYNSYKCLLQWDEVLNATGYTLKIDNSNTIDIYDNFYDFTNYDAGSHSVKVTATRYDWISASTTYSFTKLYLKTPTNLSATFNEETGYYNIKWDAVSKADSYKIYINGEERETITKNSYSLFRISDYFSGENLNFAIAAFDSNFDYFISSKSEELSLKKLYRITYYLNGGTNSPSNPEGYFDVIESEIVLQEPTRIGYTFAGWTKSGSPITSIPTGSTGDFNLLANWSINSYDVTLNPNGGSCSETSMNFTYGESYSLPTPTRSGYTFDGWYDGSSKFNQNGTWNYTSNYNLTAHWSIIAYSITYQLNGGTNSSSNPSTYNVESSTITLANPSKTGYTFTEWTSDGSPITSIPTGSTGDIELVANWSANQNALTITSEDTSKGTVAITSGSGCSEESITVVATPVGDCIFKGWYNESTKVSDAATYTFIMPTNDYSLVAHFFTKAEEEKELWNIAHGVIPTLSNDGKTITYGLYPQTNVNDSVLVSALNSLTKPESNGWYLYNDEYYAKASAELSYSNYTFDNGTTIVKDTTYWFKCEPITWNVLSNNNGEYYILSGALVDAHYCYYTTSSRTIGGKTIYANNYEYSDIRAWLNNDFYNTAFALDNSCIQTTTVYNNAFTTSSNSNSYACNNTQDKVFLPCYQDYLNSRYGFSTSSDSTNTRYCKTTDWARARGAFYNTSSSYLYNGNYWTRSPASYDSRFVWYVTAGGSLRTDTVSTDYGVRPSLTIKIA